MLGWVGIGSTGWGKPFSLPEETRPVTDSVEEVSRVDEVDGLGVEEPVFFCVVDFEAEVRWDPGMVRWAEIEEIHGVPCGLYRTW